MAIIIGASVGVVYYTSFYLPESLAKPSVSEEILEPVKNTIIEMIEGSASSSQQDNFVPKLVNIQLGIDNLVIWKTQPFKGEMRSNYITITRYCIIIQRSKKYEKLQVSTVSKFRTRVQITK